MRQTHTSDGRLIDRHGIPEGGKPATSVTYFEPDGEERFRCNMGVSYRLPGEPPTLATIVERLRPIAADLRVVAGDLRNQARTNSERGVSVLNDLATAELLLDEIDRATGHL